MNFPFSFSNFFKSDHFLIEGGNVFGNTSPIKKQYIEPTLTEFVKQLGAIFPKAKSHFKKLVTLGSVGKKEISGDIDLALSEDSFENVAEWDLDPKLVQGHFELFKKRAKTSTDQQIMKRAVIVSIAEKIEKSTNDIGVDAKGSSTGALFFTFPQYNENGDQTSERVQIDINIGNTDWLKFSYYSSVYKGNVKGLHRTQLLVSLFANKGYIFSHNYGVKNKQTQEIEATDPQQAIELLNNLYDLNLDQTIMENYFSLMDTLRESLSEEDLKKVFDTYLRILDSTRADIPDDLQSYWIDNQERLQLKGNFLPAESKLVKYKKAL